MARSSINITVGAAKGYDGYSTSGGQADSGTDASTAVTDAAAMVAAQTPAAAAMAVLVADGASPTQAHVTTMNGLYTTLAAAVAACNTDIGNLNTALSAGVVISWDTTKVTSINQLKAAFAEALRAAQGGGILTA